MKTLNNNIKEQKVGFDNAKLLKEKGFDCLCSFAFNGAYEPHHLNIIELFFKQSNSELIEKIFTAPTQQLALDWIRINFNIHITITSISQESWQFHITRIGDRLGENYGEDFYTPEEAKEAAINYVLTKLI